MEFAYLIPFPYWNPGNNLPTMNCINCSVEIAKRGNHQKYCLECYHDRHKQQMREYIKKRNLKLQAAC